MNGSEILVRLMGVSRQELKDAEQSSRWSSRAGRSGSADPQFAGQDAVRGEGRLRNYYFNKLERDELLKSFASHGKFDDMKGNWVINAGGTVKGKRAVSKITIEHKGAKDKINDAVHSIVDGLTDDLEPLAEKQDPDALKGPSGSGGLILALYHYRQLLAYGEKGFGGRLTHGGSEPFYLPPPEKDRPNYKDLRVDCDVLRGEFAGKPTKWYFVRKDEKRTANGKVYTLQKGQLLGFETQVNDNEDPCEVYLLDYEKSDGRMLPPRNPRALQGQQLRGLHGRAV